MPLPRAPGERGAGTPGRGEGCDPEREIAPSVPGPPRSGSRWPRVDGACQHRWPVLRARSRGRLQAKAALRLRWNFQHTGRRCPGGQTGGGLLAHALRAGHPQGDARTVLAMVAEPERVSGERFGGGGRCRPEAGDGGSLDSASRVELGAVSGAAGLARSRASISAAIGWG